MIELHPAQLAEHGLDAASIIERLLEIDYRGWVIAHATGDVRRAAYGRWTPDEDAVRPMRWPEPLDIWPHLIFAFGDHPLEADSSKMGTQ